MLFMLYYTDLSICHACMHPVCTKTVTSLIFLCSVTPRLTHVHEPR